MLKDMPKGALKNVPKGVLKNVPKGALKGVYLLFRGRYICSVQYAAVNKF